MVAGLWGAACLDLGSRGFVVFWLRILRLGSWFLVSWVLRRRGLGCWGNLFRNRPLSEVLIFLAGACPFFRPRSLLKVEKFFLKTTYCVREFFVLRLDLYLGVEALWRWGLGVGR